MENIAEIIPPVIKGISVAISLLNTSGPSGTPRAIEVCKECLILLDKKGTDKERPFVKFLYKEIYSLMFEGYRLIQDHTSGIECGEKLLVALDPR